MHNNIVIWWIYDKFVNCWHVQDVLDIVCERPSDMDWNTSFVVEFVLKFYIGLLCTNTHDFVSWPIPSFYRDYLFVQLIILRFNLFHSLLAECCMVTVFFLFSLLLICAIDNPPFLLIYSLLAGYCPFYCLVSYQWWEAEENAKLSVTATVVWLVIEYLRFPPFYGCLLVCLASLSWFFQTSGTKSWEANWCLTVYWYQSSPRIFFKCPRNFWSNEISDKKNLLTRKWPKIAYHFQKKPPQQWYSKEKYQIAMQSIGVWSLWGLSLSSTCFSSLSGHNHVCHALLKYTTCVCFMI